MHIQKKKGELTHENEIEIHADMIYNITYEHIIISSYMSFTFFFFITM